MRYGNSVEEFDEILDMTLKDIRSHFGVTGGSLKVEGKIIFAKEDVVVSPGTYVLDVPQTNQGMKHLFFFHISRVYICSLFIFYPPILHLPCPLSTHSSKMCHR